MVIEGGCCVYCVCAQTSFCLVLPLSSLPWDIAGCSPHPHCSLLPYMSRLVGEVAGRGREQQ